MKIFVKTLKGDRFEILVNPQDSVADVKKNIETVLGTSAYPAAEQMLIHKGKVLKDETTVEANNVSEKSIIGVMKRKPASTGTSTSTETPIDIPVTPTEPASAGASYVSSERISESSIQNILGMEYLYFGTQDQTQEPEAPEEADQERFNDTPEHEYLRAKVQSDPSIVKDFLESLEEQNPALFQSIQDNKAVFLLLLEVEGGCGNEMEQPHELQADQNNDEPNNEGDGGNQVGESEETEVDEQHQELQADQTNKPNNGGGDGGNLVGESKETEVEVATPEDYELIARLEALGFERGDAEVAYFACNKNVQEAANRLLGYKHESQE